TTPTAPRASCPRSGPLTADSGPPVTRVPAGPPGAPPAAWPAAQARPDGGRADPRDPWDNLSSPTGPQGTTPRGAPAPAGSKPVRTGPRRKRDLPPRPRSRSD